MKHITKTDRLITKNSKHVKATLITSEQYLQDQVSRNTVDDFLKYFEKHTQ